MMRHRPDLCVGGTAAGGTTALPTGGFSTLAIARAIEQMSTQRTIWTLTSAHRAALRARRPRGCRARRPRPVQPEALAALRAGSTMPATITGARAGSRPADLLALARSGSVGERSRDRAQTRRVVEHVALDPRGVVGLEREVDRGALGRRAGHGDRVAARGSRAGSALRTSSRERVAARPASAGRRAGGARCGGRRRSASTRGTSPRRACRSRARSSRRRCRSPAAASASSRSAVAPRVGQPRLLVAAERAGREAERVAATRCGERRRRWPRRARPRSSPPRAVARRAIGLAVASSTSSTRCCGVVAEAARCGRRPRRAA